MQNILKSLSLALLLTATAAIAHADELVGTFTDWHVQSYKEGRNQVCLMWSQPKKAKGKYKKRGEIYTYVTHRPAQKHLNEISISIGYTFKKGSPVEVRIAKTKIRMFSDGDTAWNRNPAEDIKMIRAMSLGSSMTILGLSARGTRTRDTYSLKGFTKAYKALGRSCKTGRSKKKRRKKK
jgi:invasion protein IalB